MTSTINRTSFIGVSAGFKAKLATISLLLVWIYSFSGPLAAITNGLTLSLKEPHSLFLLPIASLLFLQKTNQLSRVSLVSSQTGLFLLSLISLAWAVASLLSLTFIAQLLSLAMLPAIIMTTCGLKCTRILGFPMLLLLLSLPFGESFSQNLSNLFIHCYIKTLSLFKVDVYWDLNRIIINNTTIDHLAQTAALQYVLSASCCGLVFSCLILKTFKQRALASLSFLVFPLIGMLVGFTFLTITQQINQANASTLTTYSYVFFIFSIIMSVIFSLYLRTTGTHHTTIKDIDWHDSYRFAQLRWLKPTMVAACVLFTMPFSINKIFNSVVNFKGNVQLILPNQLNTWHKEANVIGEPVPNALYVARAYQNAQHLPLILNVTYFINSIQTYKNKDFIVNSPLWSLHQTKLRKIPLDNQEIKVVERIYTKNNHHRLVWDFYLIHGEVIPNKHAAQVKDNIRSFITQKRNSSYISIECDFETTVEQARHAMADFCQNLLLNINSIVPPAIKLN